jgi:hypothetical protein
MFRNNPTHVRFLSLEHGTIFVGVRSPHGLNEVRKNSFLVFLQFLKWDFQNKMLFRVISSFIEVGNSDVSVIMW